MINFKDAAKQFSKIISCPYFGDRPIPTKYKGCTMVWLSFLQPI